MLGFRYFSIGFSKMTVLVIIIGSTIKKCALFIKITA